MTTTEFDDAVEEGEDNPTLSEYIASLSTEDKQLISDFSIDIEELLLMDIDDFDDLINKSLPDLDEQQQSRRIEIIKRIIDLQADEKVLEGGNMHQYNFRLDNGNGNGNSNGKHNNDVKELQLCPKLKESGIVTSLVLYASKKTVELLLNHKYESKTVIFPINLDRSNWSDFIDSSGKTLKKKGVSQQHIQMLLDALDDNWKKIFELVQKSDSDTEDSDSEEKKTVAQKALAIAEDQCSELFQDQFGMEYVAIKINEHTEVLRLKDSRFRNWLCKEYYTSENKILNAESVTNVLNILKAKAEFEGATKTLDLRVTSMQDQPFIIYYDLANRNWEAIKITPEGWNIEPSPIIFRRYKSQQPQVYPSRQYPAELFDKFIELAPKYRPTKSLKIVLKVVRRTILAIRTILSVARGKALIMVTQVQKMGQRLERR